jgi:hypothetical protein
MERNRDRKDRIGALPPRYAFVLNPHADTKFTRCPRCETRTNLRKLSLVIHVGGFGLVILGTTCRLCLRCETLIAHKAELRQIAQHRGYRANTGLRRARHIGSTDVPPGSGRNRLNRRGEGAHVALQVVLERRNYAARLVSEERHRQGWVDWRAPSALRRRSRLKRPGVR